MVAAVAGLTAPAGAGSEGGKIRPRLERLLSDRAPDDRVGVIVTLRVPATASRVAAIEGDVGGFSLRHRFSIIPAFSATMTKRQLETVARRPEVARVDENRKVRAFNDSAQSSFGVTKARTDASVDGNAAAGGYFKGDLVAAVLDTGIHAGHPDLNGGKVIAFADCTVAVTCVETSPFDDEGHGTHVAGILAGDGEASGGRYKGVAPGGALVGVRVLPALGQGSSDHLIAGIDWTLQHKAEYGIEAINISLGNDVCIEGNAADDPASTAANNSVDAGLVVVAAAGNTGPDRCTIGPPADAARVLTVGAMADLGADDPQLPIGDPFFPGFHQANFSSRGPTDGRIKPDVSAPGVNITSANGNPATRGGQPYVQLDGTSMASPFVAGVALLMLDENPGLSPQQVKDRIMGTAVDWGRGGTADSPGTTGADIDYGAGRLDAYAAIDAAGSGIAAPPRVPDHVLREGTLPGDDAVMDFPLEVGTGFPIAATLIVPAVGPDFDVLLLDPAGNTVARSERGTMFGGGRQEELGHRPAGPGTYKVRVKSFAGAGPFFVDISADVPGLAPVDKRAPRIALLVRRVHRLRTVLRRRGLRFRVRSDEPGTIRARLTVSRRLARRLGIVRRRRGGRVTIARVSKTIGRPRTARMKARMSRRVRRRLRRTRRRRMGATLRVSVTDRAGNVSGASKRITLKR